MAAGLTNPSTGVAWVLGDAQCRTPGLDGFAWGGVVYVNGVTRLVTATAHEMLHNNTAAGVTIAAGRSAHPRKVAIVEALVPFMGETTLTNAYFSGAPALVTAYETARGAAGSWPALTAACDTGPGHGTPLLAAVPAMTHTSPTT